jgi:hypothetical protein
MMSKMRRVQRNSQLPGKSNTRKIHKKMVKHFLSRYPSATSKKMVNLG